jgi:hypothetical protein
MLSDIVCWCILMGENGLPLEQIALSLPHALQAVCLKIPASQGKQELVSVDMLWL